MFFLGCPPLVGVSCGFAFLFSSLMVGGWLEFERFERFDGFDGLFHFLGIGPELFETVEVAFVFLEDMYHNVEVVH